MSWWRNPFLWGYLILGLPLLGIELWRVADPAPEDTITETILTPVANFDLAGFPIGLTLFVGFMGWLVLHVVARRRKRI